MGITWYDSPKGYGPVVVFSDPYTLLEWRDIVTVMADRRQSGAPLRVLIDGRECTPPTAEFVVRALSVLETRDGYATGGRVAIVVSSDKAFAMGRLAEAAVDIRKLPFVVRTFRDVQDAERWLEPTASFEGV
jgi:hypothetical protein